MPPYAPKKFALPALEGLSEKAVTAHLGLYEGYVKNANLILEKIEELAKDSEKNAYVLGELQRRFAFEFDGMRNHEYYFEGFEGGPAPLPADSELAKSLAYLWGSVDAFLARFKAIATTRGVGWAMLYFDPHAKRLLTQWVDEQHLGHLTGLVPILTLDMWEHSYVMDYLPSEKGKYIEAFFANLNWETVAKRLDDAAKQ